jgi:hypothetical protein
MAELFRRWAKRERELRSILEDRRDWRPGLEEVLRRYVRTAQLAERLWDELQGIDGLLDEGSAKQERTHPLVASFLNAEREAASLGARLGLTIAPPTRSMGRPVGSAPLDGLQRPPSAVVRELRRANSA